MASTVIVHQLAGTKKALEACRLIEALYLAGKRTVVWVSDAGRAAVLDDMLWTFSQSSFIPHELWDGAGEASDQVVLVTGTLANPNGADVLVVVDSLAQPETAKEFREIHDLVAQAAEDASKAAGWEAAGFKVKQVQGVSRRGR